VRYSPSAFGSLSSACSVNEELLRPGETPYTWPSPCVLASALAVAQSFASKLRLAALPLGLEPFAGYAARSRCPSWAPAASPLFIHSFLLDADADASQDLQPLEKLTAIITTARRPCSANAGPARCRPRGQGARRIIGVGRVLGGSPIKSRIHGNRPGCACAEARDIGEYDTCPHGCVYCYAVRDRDLARRRHREHDPKSEFLFPPSSNVADAAEISNQPRLF